MSKHTSGQVPAEKETAALCKSNRNLKSSRDGRLVAALGGFSFDRNSRKEAQQSKPWPQRYRELGGEERLGLQRKDQASS